MASTALAERPIVAIQTVTGDELDLVKRTVATGATEAELKLYLYDCQRQGVHPLDRLLHFTKRGGKYTPVTSIDLMRTRAADTGEYAGSDDAVFVGSPKEPDLFQAAVTVWRLVQGQRCSFTATARWSEYKPDAAHMWQRMPHTMLAKCAEALALRKGFPRQLAGLYAAEEMAQADNRTSYSVEPAKAELAKPQAEAPLGASEYASTQNTQAVPDDGQTRIVRVDSTPTKNRNVTKYLIVLSTGEQVSTINQQIASLCEQLCQENAPVTVETKETRWGVDLTSIHRADIQIAREPGSDDEPPMSGDDSAF